MIQTGSEIGFSRVPLDMTEGLLASLHGINDSYILLNEQGLDESSILAQCPFPELYVGLPCDVGALADRIVDCAVLVQQRLLVPRIPVIEAYASLMQTLVSKVSMGDGSLGQYQPSTFVLEGLDNEDTFELVGSLYTRACEEQKHMVRFSPKHAQYFHQMKTKWAYVAMCPQIDVNKRLQELEFVQNVDFEIAIEHLIERLEHLSWSTCSRPRPDASSMMSSHNAATEHSTRNLSHHAPPSFLAPSVPQHVPNMQFWSSPLTPPPPSVSPLPERAPEPRRRSPEPDLTLTSPPPRSPIPVAPTTASPPPRSPIPVEPTTASPPTRSPPPVEPTTASPPPRSQLPDSERKPPSSSSLHPSSFGVVDSANNNNYSDQAIEVPCDSYEQVDALIDELVERARVIFEHEILSGSSEFFFSIRYFRNVKIIRAL